LSIKTQTLITQKSVNRAYLHLYVLHDIAALTGILQLIKDTHTVRTIQIQYSLIWNHQGHCSWILVNS